MPARRYAIALGHQCVEGRVARFKGERRIARAEPCFIEVVRLGGQSRARLDERLGNLAGRRLAARDVAVHRVDQLGDARVALGDLRVAFREGNFGRLGRLLERFLDWAFEAFDGEEWRRLLHSRTSPWPGGFYLGGDGAVVFQLWYPFASTRFRIRLLEPALSMHPHRCMHIRGLELYGTIMPPWRID